MPLTDYRRFGFEIEFNHSVTELSQIVTDAVSNYGIHNIRTYHESSNEWNLKNEHTGSELTSPALYSSPENFIRVGEIFDYIRRISREQELSPITNRACGFHVHFEIKDFNDEEIRKLIETIQHFEPALFLIQPRSRSNSGYVRSIHSRENILEDLTDHYDAFNFCRYSFPDRATCEFRYAASTIRRKKINNWIQLLLFLVESSKENIDLAPYESNIIGLCSFIRNTNLTKKNKWLSERRKDKIVEFINTRNEQLYPVTQENTECVSELN